MSLYHAVLFLPVTESRETNPWRTLSRSDDVDTLWLCDFSPRRKASVPVGSTSARTLCRWGDGFDAESAPELRDLRSVGGE